MCGVTLIAHIQLTLSFRFHRQQITRTARRSTSAGSYGEVPIMNALSAKIAAPRIRLTAYLVLNAVSARPQRSAKMVSTVQISPIGVACAQTV